MLKVTVAEVNRAAARSIGMNFSVTNNSGITTFTQSTGPVGSANATGSAAASTGASSSGGVNLTAIFNNGNVPFFINALRTLNLARSLAEPNLVTLNGHTASFQAGENSRCRS